jgi:hypothetical protein
MSDRNCGKRAGARRERGCFAMTPFDGNDYRKRVLAAVQGRGGPEASDAFELYDIELDDAGRLNDAAVAEQVGEVWAFWQRQRDHPKYGTLVSLLVDSHEQRSVDMLDGNRRRALADQVRAERERRHAVRYELLDQAIRRLVERHRGIPRDKVDGLIEIGSLGGLSAAEVQARLRRHRLVDPVPAVAPPVPSGAVLSAHRRRQVRDLLDEYGRLDETPAPATLLSLLGLSTDATAAEIALRAEAWRVRCRELPPLRIRAVADELLVHVRDLLESGRATLEAYLDAVADDVRERLRPRVRAAVLVEDHLVADDHEHLLGEAQALGLDEARARAVLDAIAAELGVAVDAGRPQPGAPGPVPPSAPTRPPPAGRSWEEPLRAARAALRRGVLHEARRLVEQARSVAGAGGTTPVRAVADEISDALEEAELRWRAASTALTARRFAEAVEHLEYLCRAAVDVQGPAGSDSAQAELARARSQVADADRQVASALAGPDPAAALLAILQTWPQHPSALAALAAMPLHPPGVVRAARKHDGSVLVSWLPSPSADVSYRVSRRGEDGSWRVIGRTSATSVEDGGASAGRTPEYAVVAVRAQRSSAEVRSGEPPDPVQPPAVPAPQPAARSAAPMPSDTPAPADVVARRAAGGSVMVSWTGPPGAEFKVSRRAADGHWKVVGRTRALCLEDGGVAGAGALPDYAVTARLDDGATSAQARSSGT